MRLITKSVCALTVVAAIVGAPASAAIVSADFEAQFDQPDSSSVTGAVELENLGAALGAGDELDLSNTIANPSGLSGGLSVDLTSGGLLTLTGQGGDFDYASVMISNMDIARGREIIGFSLIGGSLTTGSNLFDSFGAIPSTFFRMGADFFLVGIDTSGIGGDADFTFANGGTAQIQLELSELAPVPLPAGIVLLGTGLAGFAVARRKKAKS